MQLQEILRNKGSDVRTIGPDATLDDVVQELVRCNIGSLVVCETDSDDAEPRVLGIITERDILRAQAAHRAPLDELLVSNNMSTDLITAGPHDGIDYAMGMMTKKRIRHLPVVVEGRLRGMISIGDVVKAHHDALEMENHYMRSYIQGEGAEIGTQP
jgi:CBS domain-containing protein